MPEIMLGTGVTWGNNLLPPGITPPRAEGHVVHFATWEWVLPVQGGSGAPGQGGGVGLCFRFAPYLRLVFG